MSTSGVPRAYRSVPGRSPPTFTARSHRASAASAWSWRFRVTQGQACTASAAPSPCTSRRARRSGCRRSTSRRKILAEKRMALLEQAEQTGKPPAIVAKMVEGRLQKYFDEVVLERQPFVLNPDQRVGEALREAAAATGTRVDRRIRPLQGGRGSRQDGRMKFTASCFTSATVHDRVAPSPSSREASWLEAQP